jgi:hypothetical protein
VSTEEEIARLEGDRLGQEGRIWVSHFFSHFGSSRPERQAFRDQMTDAGFGVGGEVGSDEEVTGDGYWHHYAHTRVAPSADICRAMDGKAADIAASRGVRYDLWHVARDRAGRPQDLSHHWARSVE